MCFFPGGSINDPRKWFSADTETLRRRLSWVESVNSLRRFASRIRKKQQPNDQSANEILQEFSQKAQQQRSNEESRRIVEDFVAEIRAREEEKAKNDPDYSTIVNSSSSDCLTSEQLSERLRRFRNMTKRSSFTTLDKGDTAAALESVAPIYGRPLRPRSFTTGPLLNDEQTVLNFQTLNKSSSKSLARLGSFRGTGELKPFLGKTLTSEPGREKVLQMFARKGSKPKSFKSQNASFVVSKEDSLETLRFKNIVRSTMERKRKWFEGNEPDTSDITTKIQEDEDAQRKNSKGKLSLKQSLSIALQKNAEAGGLKMQMTLPAIRIENNETDEVSKNDNSGIEEPAKRDKPTHTETGCGANEMKAEPVNSNNSSINKDCTCQRPQNTSELCNSSDNSKFGQHNNKSSSSKLQNTTALSTSSKNDSSSNDSNNNSNKNSSKSNNNANKPKGTSLSPEESLQNEKEKQKQHKDEKKLQQNFSRSEEAQSSREKNSEQNNPKQTTLTLLHPAAQCACSEVDTARKTPQAPENRDKKKTAVTDAKKEPNRDVSNTKEKKKTAKEKQTRMEETCC